MKQLRLGIVGAENSHSLRIAEMCNLQKVVPMRVTTLWGETEELAQSCALKGLIPRVVADWRKMAGEVDGVMIDHRHGKHHARVAEYFLEKGLPVFVDKPITCDLASARKLFKFSNERGVPLMTFSAKPLSNDFQRYVRRIQGAGSVQAFHSWGPAEIDSPYGGIYFYGIHQVDCAIEILGTAVREVFVHRTSPTDGIASLSFEGGATASMHLLGASDSEFRWSVLAGGRNFDLEDKPNPRFYAKSAKLISDFLRTGQSPFSQERMLAPIAVLDAMRASLKTRKPVRISR